MCKKNYVVYFLVQKIYHIEKIVIKQLSFPWKLNESVFRPPFINGRPQDSVSVFWTLVPFFEPKPPFFSVASFLKRSHQGTPGVTGGHQGSIGETRGDRVET